MKPRRFSQLKPSNSLRWTIENIPFERIDVSKINRRDDLFLLLTAGSFIEAASIIYARNLAEFFNGDQEVTEWLINTWEREEVQHGKALRRFIVSVWPDFNWESAYNEFLAEILPKSTVELLEHTRALEMVGRCVIEIGTSSIYRAIHELVEEPVLMLILDKIKRDELRHYKYFYRYFVKYNQTLPHSRASLVGALLRRMFRGRNNSLECAFRCAFKNRYSDRTSRDFKRITGDLIYQLKQYYPTEMAIKLLCKPLELPTSVQRIIIQFAKLTHWSLGPFTGIVNYIIFH